MDYFEQLKPQASERQRLSGDRLRRRVVSDIRPPAAPPAKPPERELPPRGGKTPRQPVLARELPVRTWEPDGARRARARRRILGAISVAAVGLGVTLPTFVFPKFTIIITPKAETVAVPDVELLGTTAASAPDAAGRRISAILIEAENTFRQEYETTGTKFFQERARGQVLLYNAYSSSPQSLVAQTRLQDATGKIFRLASGLTVPGAKIEEGKIVPTATAASVVADQPGEGANIGPTQFRIPGFRGTPKYQGFYAESKGAFSGGFVGEAKVIAADDLRRASEDLSKRAVEELGRELDRKKPADPDFLAPEGAREVAVTHIESPTAGERAERFALGLTARGRLVVFRRSQAIGVLAELLLPRDAALDVKPSAAQPDLVLGQARLAARPGELKIRASGQLAFRRESKVDELAAIFRASTPAKTETYLRGREEIASFHIKRFPRWLWYIPGRPAGLDIRIAPPA